MLSNTLKGFLIVPYGKACFFAGENRVLINSSHKIAATNYRFDKCGYGVLLPLLFSLLNSGTNLFSG